MSASTSLKTCPFCGESDLALTSNGFESHSVSCNNCGAEGPANTNDSKASIAWNRRAPSEPGEALQVLRELVAAATEFLALNNACAGADRLRRALAAQGEPK